MEATDCGNAWLSLASSAISDSEWELAIERPQTSLSHRSCPWGGHLVKFQSRNIFLQAAPADPSCVLVRPEVRGGYKGAPMEMDVQCQQVLAPGDAVVERRTRMWVVRMICLLFGNCGRQKGNGCKGFFYDFDTAHTARHQIRRNFPEQGDCSYVGQGCLWMTRPESGSVGNRFRVILVFRTPEPIQFAPWANCLFSMITDMLHKAVERTLNSRAYQEMRQIDADCYVVLSMRSFNRGPPMIPEVIDEAESYKVTSGETFGLALWSRFPLDPNGRFRLSDYLRRFLQLLGHKLVTYETLDGGMLVSYQCVVLREEWNKVKQTFWDAFRIQKAAYRYANGGSSAPSLIQDVSPNLLRNQDVEPQEVGLRSLKTVVRNTFLELDDEERPPMRRTRSDLSGDVNTFLV